MSDDTDEIDVIEPPAPRPGRSLALVGALVAFVALAVTVLVLVSGGGWRDEATSADIFPVHADEEWTSSSDSWTAEPSETMYTSLAGMASPVPTTTAVAPATSRAASQNLATQAPATSPAPATSTASPSPTSTASPTTTKGHGRPKPTKPVR